MVIRFLEGRKIFQASLGVANQKSLRTPDICKCITIRSLVITIAFLLTWANQNSYLNSEIFIYLFFDFFQSWFLVLARIKWIPFKGKVDFVTSSHSSNFFFKFKQKMLILLICTNVLQIWSNSVITNSTRPAIFVRYN